MYPAPARSLLPRVLRSAIGGEPIRDSVARRVGVPSNTTLADLDETVWRGRRAEEVRQLASEVVRVLNQGLPAELHDMPLFGDRLAVDRLDLSIRTRNALHYGRLVEAGRLRPTTVERVWRLPNFGAVSLLDLLTAVEVTAPWSLGLREADGGGNSSPAIQRAAGSLARKRWAGLITAGDPRLGTELATLDSDAKTPREAAEALAGARYTPSAAKRTAAAIRDFIDRVDALRKIELETELDQIVDAFIDRPSAKAAIMARTGFSGSEPLTLELAGQTAAVTRERARQIVRRFRDQIDSCDGIWSPVLDRALQLAADSLPTSPSKLEAALLEAGLTRGRFSTASLVAAAETFHRELPFTKLGEHLVPPGNWAPPSIVNTTTRRLVAHWGATTLADVEIRLKEEGFEAESGLLRLTVEGLQGFGWLDEVRGWFWVRQTQNRLLNQVHKIMSVAGSIDLTELRVGVGRPHRMLGFRPPREVLATLCVESGMYYREGERISGGQDLPDWRDVLSDNERKLAQTLFDYGPVMRRDDLERVVVVERGLNRSSFYVYLTYSPIIMRYAPGVFGLRGAPVTAAEVEAMIPPRMRHQVLQDHGWTDDGRLWAAFRLSPAAAATGVLGTPAAVRSVTRGSYNLFDEDARPAGTLVVEESMWGLSPFFHRWGVEASDLVVIIFDLTSRQATIAAGSDELLLRYQGGE